MFILMALICMNLYYGALENTSYKWLDLYSFGKNSYQKKILYTPYSVCKPQLRL